MKTFLIRILFFSIIIIFSFHQAVSQEKRSHEAVRIVSEVHIDGVLDEEFWSKLSPAKDFYQYSPYVKDKPARFNSKVYLAYDDAAIYVGAYLYDDNPDSILREYSRRDDIKNTSYFTIYIDPYGDSKVSNGFGVTASGIQYDMKSTESNGEDRGWDAVWKSGVSYTEQGWVVEMRIPYSALRIPSQSDEWGVQYIRQIRRYREQTVWNPMDPNKDGFLNQFGKLKGIKDIEPPLRLSLMPYLSSYADYYTKEDAWEYSYKGGMDLKYGINESFTLDMILIPDFGQVQSDDRVVNLSPYEQYYDEKRAFFMEGTELFDRGDIFYSRRIGSEPVNYYAVDDSLQADEEISSNPDAPQLINATKFSGKTSNGLGVGILNAMTAGTSATIRDTITGEKRQVKTDPFTNYNMVVVDKSINTNSYVSFANTNVYRGTDFYTANVSALDFKISDTSNTYAISGVGALSQQYYPDKNNNFGHRYWLNAGKVSGDFTYSISQLVESDTYDPNDLGFLQSNNDFVTSLNFAYRKFEPTGLYQSWRNNLNVSYSQQNKPREFVNIDMWGQSVMTLKNYTTIGINSYIRPTTTNDFNEPRVEGWKYVAPKYYEAGFFVSPDYRKSFLIDVSGEYGVSPRDEYSRYDMEISPRARLSDKLTLSHELEIEHSVNENGYVDSETSGEQTEIIFGRRNKHNVTNTLDASYIFNDKSALAFRMRHYWLKVNYNSFFQLTPDGLLNEIEYQDNEDFSTNIFNIDMTYSWRFAPGSEMSVVWKNAIYKEEEDTLDNYFSNIEKVINAPGSNSLSLKILYYIDYEQVFKNRNS
mgnify:CR=1 FL=1